MNQMLTQSSDQRNCTLSLHVVASVLYAVNHLCCRETKFYLPRNKWPPNSWWCVRDKRLAESDNELASWQSQSEWNDNGDGHALYLLLLDVHVALLWPIKGGIRFVSRHPWAGASIGNNDLKLCARFQMVIAVCDIAAATAGGTLHTVRTINAFILKCNCARSYQCKSHTLGLH